MLACADGTADCDEEAAQRKQTQLQQEDVAGEIEDTLAPKEDGDKSPSPNEYGIDPDGPFGPQENPCIGKPMC